MPRRVADKISPKPGAVFAHIVSTGLGTGAAVYH